MTERPHPAARVFEALEKPELRPALARALARLTGDQWLEVRPTGPPNIVVWAPEGLPRPARPAHPHGQGMKAYEERRRANAASVRRLRIAQGVGGILLTLLALALAWRLS